MRNKLDKLAYTLYITHAVNLYLLYKDFYPKTKPDEYCKDWLYEWEKYRGDWRQIARQYLNHKL